jgi:hypothetical protein
MIYGRERTMHRVVVGRAHQRLVRVVAAAGATLALSGALPRQADAQPWVQTDPGGYCFSGTVPGAYNAVRHMPNGIAYVHECYLDSYNWAGTIYYYQSALVVLYREYWSGAADVFSGQSMAVQVGRGVTSSTLCPARTWHDGDLFTCFSGTVPYPVPASSPTRASFYAKGIVTDYAAVQHPFWTPVSPLP